MEELLNFIFYALVGYVVARILLHIVYKMLQAKNEELKEKLVELAKQFIFVKPEKHGDVIYLFEAETDRFIAQGRTAQELKEHCRERFPDKNVVISNDYLKQFSELNELTELKNT